MKPSHLRIIQEDVILHQCFYCDISFSSELELESHNMEEHIELVKEENESEVDEDPLSLVHERKNL